MDVALNENDVNNELRDGVEVMEVAVDAGTGVGEAEVKRVIRGGGDTEESLKETFESIVISFFLVFVFRSFIVEPFIIPTGSMAPTLMGLHDPVQCESCLYQFDRGRQSDASGVKLIDYDCPMCNFSGDFEAVARAGDRILVHKYIYDLIEPKRWDVIVFKNPKTPYTNYIKRLVGLPGEDLWIVDGNVYVKPWGEEKFRVARKTGRVAGVIDGRGESIQRAVWQPIYHSSYVPDEKLVLDWGSPWVEVGDGGGWKIGRDRAYTYLGQGDGAITFEFDRFNTQRHGYYAYNQSSYYMRVTPRIEDVRVAGGFELLEDKPTKVVLETSCRMDDVKGEMRRLWAEVDEAGEVSLWAGDMLVEGEKGADSKVRLLPDFVKEGAGVKFARGRSVDLELWFVDQQASFWVDGELVMSKNFDGLSIDALMGRANGNEREPRIRIGIAGGKMRVHRVEVDRDLYYHDAYDQQEGLLGVYRKGKRGNELALGKDHFFALGDNSPNSADSRYWKDSTWGPTNPWLVKRHFQEWMDEKEGRAPEGRVHRDTLMGQAFAVYFPSAYGKGKKSSSLIPDFGRMRLIK